MTIGILDEVTGLGLNPVVYPMTAVDAQRYTVKLPIALNSLVKYRYYRQGAVPAQETTPLNIPVRYRVFYVTGPGSTDDRVSSWSDSKFNGQIGRINGTVLDAGTGRPIPNIMVNAGGVSTLTDSLGQYVLEAMSVGTHTLVASALDGGYVPFQQGASVLAEQTTPAQFSMKAASTVQVTFIVSLPGDSVGGAPVRLAGNLVQFGNTFADLRGGVSTVATHAYAGSHAGWQA
jgi:hypothetical protein